MIADKNFYDIVLTFFYPMASTTAYGRRSKFVRAEHSAKTAPTVQHWRRYGMTFDANMYKLMFIFFSQKTYLENKETMRH